VYRQDGSSEFHQRADEALAEWLDGFLDRAGDGMLDELYGPADDGRPEQPDATTTAPAGLSQPAWLAPGSAGAGASTGRLHARGVLHAAAAASGRTLPLTLPRDGRIDGELGASAGSGDSGDRYTLQWPMEAGTDRPQFLPEATVEVTLDLEAAAWAHRHPRTLVLQPASQWLPLLVNWTEPGAAPPSGRWMLTAKLKMTRQAFIECQTATTLVELVVEQEGVPAA
jgi:hypothetical protein